MKVNQCHHESAYFVKWPETQKGESIMVCKDLFYGIEYFFELGSQRGEFKGWFNGTHMTWSSPRRPLCSHSMVCSENHLFIVRIGPIRDKEL